MKRIAVTLVLLLGLFAPMMAREKKTETIELPTVQCDMCKETIESKLQKLEGLQSIDVDVDTKKATVVFDSGKLTLKQIKQAISKAGYDAADVKADLKAQRKLSRCCQPDGGH